MKKSFSILIILRKDKKGVDGKCPLNVQVTLNSKVTKLPTKYKILPSEWDSGNRCCLGKGNGELNTSLKSIIVELEKFCHTRIFSNLPLTLDSIKDYYNGVSIRCFYTVFDRVFEIKAKKLRSPTVYKYNLLKKYLQEFKKHVDIADIDLQFIEKFESFLIVKGIGIHGVSNHHKNLNAIINLAIKHKLMFDNPYINKDFKEDSEKLDFLSPDELTAFSKIQTDNEGLNLTRDRFLFGCYTSLRYSDLNSLRVGDIDRKNKIIRITQIKTKKPVEVPLSTRARVLYEKYRIGKDEDELLFPSVTNQNDNERLKTLASKIDLKFNLTFHVSRHTFGTIMINHHNQPITIVSRIMGHSDISMTARYANVDISMMQQAMRKMK